MEQMRQVLPEQVAGGEAMQAPEEVAVMLRLQALGWGSKRIVC
jgi:hypothetical protein